MCGFVVFSTSAVVWLRPRLLVLRKASAGHVMQRDWSLCAQPSSVALTTLKNCGEQSRGDLVDDELGAVEKEHDGLAGGWRAFVKSGALPDLVRKNMENMLALELEIGETLVFGGPRGSLKGRPGAEEDRRHRSFYGTLSDSEQKTRNFSARQVACRIMGSKGYACGNCWLPKQDCFCESLVKGHLWEGVRLWLYMHPKDFLRKNNTGKLLWQVFGSHAACLTICGIQEQEEIMWDAFKQAGSNLVWCVFPEKNPADFMVQDIHIPDGFSLINREVEVSPQTLHLILLDGTWSNSKAMLCRLKDRATSAWAGNTLSCVSLSPTSLSVMHGLRPQPSVERTCTAAAASCLLKELSTRTELSGLRLERSAEQVDEALKKLQATLVARRKRVGRPVNRIPVHRVTQLV